MRAVEGATRVALFLRRLGFRLCIYRLLAEHHRKLAKEAVLDVVQQYHLDLARRLADEAALIPRRTAISERLRDREQQSTEKRGEDDGGE